MLRNSVLNMPGYQKEWQQISSCARNCKRGYLDVITGIYATPAAYFVAEENPEDFEKFEREFNLKNPLEKLKLPGQLA